MNFQNNKLYLGSERNEITEILLGVSRFALLI